MVLSSDPTVEFFVPPAEFPLPVPRAISWIFKYFTTPRVRILQAASDPRGNVTSWVVVRGRPVSPETIAVNVYEAPDPDRPSINGQPVFKCCRIEILSPRILKELRSVFERQNLFVPSDLAVRFSEPFRTLYFARDHISDSIESTTAEVRTDMLALQRVLDRVFSDLDTEKARFLVNGAISFPLVWTLFPIGSDVVSTAHGCPFLGKVVDIFPKEKPGKQSLVVRVVIVRYDGTQFIRERTDLSIPEFAGLLPINKLAHYPAQYLSSTEYPKDFFVSRGKKAAVRLTSTCCEYSGPALGCPNFQEEHVRLSLPCTLLLSFHPRLLWKRG
ncbi:hypothetical protein VTK73DRAFT_1409 [Phialemonium thermophilum]|uniref:DUF7025 domain-containing protein n=1 Tax=Phialemonium thermophilum TaxID=223376 RepID=A0ABR3X9M0_9PEZI